MGQSTSTTNKRSLEAEVHYPAVEVEYPPSVKYWINGAHNRDEDEAEAKKVVPWLTNCIINAHNDPNIKRAAVKLLLVREFTLDLAALKCWNPLRTALIAKLNALGVQLHDRYTELDLGNALSDKRVGCGKLKYHAMLSNKHIQHVRTAQVTHADILPNIHKLGFFEFSGDHVEAMDEHALLIVILMISQAVDAMFQKKTQKIVRKCKNSVLCEPGSSSTLVR